MSNIIKRFQKRVGDALFVALIVAPVLAKGAQAPETSADKGQEVASVVAPKGPSPVTAGALCLIVKHKGTVGRRLVFTALIGVPIAPGAKYDLVDTLNYNPGKVAFTGKELQEAQSDGIHVIVLEKKYGQEDVQAARRSCRAPALEPRQ
jgi:hypothetical protein